MSSKSKTTRTLPRPIRTALSGLRSRIRTFVVLEGLSAVVVWLCLTFWLIHAIDYLPVTFGFNELPVLVRAVLLAVVVAIALWLLYHLVLRRLFVRLQNRSMSLLLERKFPDFDESLITTVEAVEGNEDPTRDPEMLEKTREQALQVISGIDVGQVINQTVLHRWLIVAAVFAFSVVGFAIARPDSFKLASQRLYMLDANTWPRRCNIEVVGIKIKRDNLIEGIEELGQVIGSRDSEFRVAKGSSVTLFVRATTIEEANNAKSRTPESCSFSYRTSQGDRGERKLKKIGAPRDGFQLYSLDGQPLQGILDDLSFTVRGGDHRVGPFNLKAVDAPTVVETNLECVFPEYMVDRQSLRWTPRTISWGGHSQLPQGTEIKIHSTANKELKKIYAYNVTTKEMSPIVADGNSFIFPIDRLLEPAKYQFYLCDSDNIVSEEPHSVSIEPIEDQAPIVHTSLDGIGTAVTPDVRIPIKGKIEDDYGVSIQWVTISTPVAVPSDETFTTTDGQIEAEIDFKERRQRTNVELPTDEESQVEIIVQAEDRFDLRDSPNVGLGDRYVLDIVSPGELLRILERLEVGHRRRLEQIYTEVTDARGYLVRSKSRQSDQSLIAEPGDEAVDEEDEDPIRRDEMRLLFAQRASLQLDKSMQETLGLAIEFDSIRKQLINNRVDSQDRIARLSDQIVGPLQLIANDSMQQLMDLIAVQEKTLLELQKNSIDRDLSQNADQQSVASLGQIDNVLNELDEVLSILVKYETQNELLDIVRRMIKEQKEINERTSKENKRKAFDRLLDLD